MTERAATSPPPPSSRSYWERVGFAFLANRMAMAGMLFVLFVTTVGVFCPLIANNRPLRIQAIFEDDYDENYFIAIEAVEALASRSGADSAKTPEQRRSDLARAIGAMRDSLAAEHRTRLDELRPALESTDAAKSAEALAAFEEEFDISNVELVPVVRWPAVRGLSRNEVVFIFLYLFAVPLWFVRRRVGGLWRFLLAVAVPAAACSAAWLAAFPPVQDAFNYRTLIESPDFAERGGRAVLAPIPYGENENITAESRQPPTFMLPPDKRVPNQHFHAFGTDTNGRDVLSRMVYGARISMTIGIVAVGIYVVIGIVLGAIAGYFGGWTDIALSRLIEIVICFPVLFLILAVQAFLQPSILNIMVALGLVYWTGVARLQRGEFLRLVNQDFVMAVKALGGSHARIIFLHILPNALGPILVLVSFGIAGSILVESTLSFLGFGVPQPTASWGDLLNNGRNDIQGTWWLTVFPGAAIFVTITCFNLVGEGVRDALDPKKRD